MSFLPRCHNHARACAGRVQACRWAADFIALTRWASSAGGRPPRRGTCSKCAGPCERSLRRYKKTVARDIPMTCAISAARIRPCPASWQTSTRRRTRQGRECGRRRRSVRCPVAGLCSARGIVACHGVTRGKSRSKLKRPSGSVEQGFESKAPGRAGVRKRRAAPAISAAARNSRGAPSWRVPLGGVRGERESARRGG